MPKWVGIVVVIAVFFAVAAWVERRRITAMEDWCRARGFTKWDPFVPSDRPHIEMLAAQAARSGIQSPRWASAIVARSGGVDVTLVEFLYTPAGRKTSVWFTLAVWPEPGARGPLVLLPGKRNAWDRAMHTVTEPLIAVGRQLLTDGSGVKEQPMLTGKRRQALEAWPHGGEFVVIDGYAAWSTEGLLRPERADQLLAQIGDARRVLDY